MKKLLISAILALTTLAAPAKSYYLLADPPSPDDERIPVNDFNDWDRKIMGYTIADGEASFHIADNVDVPWDGGGWSNNGFDFTKLETKTLLLKYRYKATGNNTTWKFKFEISKENWVFAEIATSPELRDGLWHDAIVDINKLMPGWAAAKGNDWVLMIVAEPLHGGDLLSIDDVRFVAENDDTATAGTREDICRNIEIPLPHYYGYSLLTAAPDEAQGEKPFQLRKIDCWEGTCNG